MLFNLLLANITILLFCVVFNSFFVIPVDIGNARLKVALANPTGAPITVANDAIETPSLVPDKTIKDYQNNQSSIFTFILYIFYIKLFTH